MDRTSAPVSRRRLLTGGALTVGGALAGAGITASGRPEPGGTGAGPAAPAGLGRHTEPFYGEHQAGIATRPQAHASFLAFDLAKGVDREALGRMMRLLTDDAARLTQGAPALADVEPELARMPARLTVTFGFGPGLFTAAGLDHLRPPSVKPLPPFRIDRLQQRWTGGDLLIQICADDPLTVSHAQRMLIADTRAFARLRWVQRGFGRGRAMQDNDGATQRNILGQLDGTANPVPGSELFDTVVWADREPEWFTGGTTCVVRRIRAELEAWDRADTAAKEFAVGRRLDTGAPLTGTAEHDEPDFNAVNDLGFPVISEFAHIRRARAADDRKRIFRRPYNYDEVPGTGAAPEAGLIFVTYQRDIDEQFLPIQRSLAEADLLNEWTTPIGSAVFAIPPGCAPGGWIGETLLG